MRVEAPRPGSLPISSGSVTQDEKEKSDEWHRNRVKRGIRVNVVESVKTPGGTFRPVANRFRRPGGGFVGMTGGAGIRDLVFVGHRRSDEGKGVGTNFGVGDGSGNLRHVAGNATASRRAIFVMGVLLDGAGAGTVER